MCVSPKLSVDSRETGIEKNLLDSTPKLLDKVVLLLKCKLFTMSGSFSIKTSSL